MVVGRNVCAFGQHGECSACGGYVDPKHLHAHVPFPSKGVVDQLCRECYSIVTMGALPVLQAAELAGIEKSFESLQDWLATGKCQILVQEEIPPF